MTTSERKKHQCPDCKKCQGCADTRCAVCRGKPPSRFAGMSMAEQIAMFEMVSRNHAGQGACTCRAPASGTDDAGPGA